MPVAVAQLPIYIDHVTAKTRQKRLSMDAMPLEEQKILQEKRMAQIDALTPEIRALVHEFGWLEVRSRLGMGARAMRVSIEQTKEAWRQRQAEVDLDALDLEL
jgi:hypothetical protein